MKKVCRHRVTLSAFALALYFLGSPQTCWSAKGCCGRDQNMPMPTLMTMGRITHLMIASRQRSEAKW